MAQAAGVEHIRALLRAAGRAEPVRELPDSTRTAAEAAAALGCDVAQIGKSIIFRAVADDRPVLVVASGAKRIDEARVAAALSGAIAKADAAFVRHHTGFAIGGVANGGMGLTQQELGLVLTVEELIIVFWTAPCFPH